MLNKAGKSRKICVRNDYMDTTYKAQMKKNAES